MSNLPIRPGEFPHDTPKGHHHRKNKKHHPRRPCGVVPRNPDNVTITFEHVNRGKHRKIRAVVTWDEVTRDTGGHDIAPDATGGHGTKIARYHVRLARSDDGITWDDDHTPQRGLKAKEDGDHNRTADVIFHNIQRRYWYRAQVIAVDKSGCESHWSADGDDDTWTAPELPFDNDPPPSPLNVTIFEKATNRVAVKWDAPTIDFPTRGTVSKDSGDDFLTGVGTAFAVEIGPGTEVKVGAETKLVIAVVSDTSLQVASDWSTTATGVRAYTIEPDPDVHHYVVQLSHNNRNYNPVYAHDRHAHSLHHSFKIPDDDEGDTFYARVQSIDAASNKSRWVEAALAGNSDPDEAGDGVTIGKGGGGIVQTWTLNGDAVAGYYNELFTADKDYTFRWARARAGRHDSGTHPLDGCPGPDQGLQIMIHLLSGDEDSDTDTNLFPAPTTLKIDADKHKDTAHTGTFEVDGMLEDEMLAVEIVQAGGADRAGRHVIVEIAMD